ncbi:MAG: SAM-dependent methyltransferase [bacterium]|nr:SAM-dependent methyltransferase [bacterium]
MGNALSFFQEFIKHPTHVGAIAPSSQALAKEMMAQARVAECQTLAEFGAGTGVFTKAALKTLPEQAVFIAIEQNANLVRCLREDLAKECAQAPPPAWSQRYAEPPVYCDTVENLPALMQQNKISQLDSIISGLPWAAFSDELQDRLLQVALDALKPNGIFCTFAYLQGLLLPAGKHFAQKINSRFAEVHKSRVVWANLPPAFIYCCRK